MRTECTQPFRKPVECGQTLYARVTTRNIDNDQLTLYIFRSSNNGENPKSNYVYPQFRSIIPCEVLLYIEVTFLEFIHWYGDFPGFLVLV